MHHVGRQRMVFLQRAVLDARQDADGADRVLVDGVGVVHVVLRLRDDPAEVGHEAAEHAGLVETPQGRLRIVARGQHRHEQAIGFRIVAQSVDQPDVLRDQPQRRGMDVELVLLRDMEQAQDRHRILLEGVGRRGGQPLAVEPEAVELARPQALPQGGELGLAAPAVLERGDEDSRQVADRLRMKIIVLHEALDAAAARPVLVAEARGDLALEIERETVVGAAREIMDVAAHRGEEAIGALEMARLVLGQHALVDQLGGLAHAIEILGDPEQRVQVAQPALALLDVGLDDVARVAHAGVALVALAELGLDEVAAVAAGELRRVALHQLVEQLAVAPDVARLEQSGADRLVALGIAQALLDRARGVPDLQAEVPEQVEHEFDDLLAARRLLVGPQEQQIDVAERRHLAPAEAAGRDHAQPFGGAGIGGGIGAAVGEVEDHADQLVHQERGRGQHRRPVVLERARLLEAAADLGAAGRQRLAQQGEHLGPRQVGAGRHVLDQLGQGILQRAATDDRAAVGDGIVGSGHCGRILQGRGRLK